MGKRKVGDTPFDLQAYFEVLDSVPDKDGGITGPDQNFQEYFMPILRTWATTTLQRPQAKRHNLGKVVEDACYQTWRKITNQSYPFTEVRRRGKGDPALTAEQNDTLKGTFDSPSELVAYLQSVYQMPQASLPNRKASASAAFSEQEATPHPDFNIPEGSKAPNYPFSQTPGESRSPGRLGLRPRKGKEKEKTTKEIQKQEEPEHGYSTAQMVPIDQMELASDAGSTPEPETPRESSVETAPSVPQHQESLEAQKDAEASVPFATSASPARQLSRPSTEEEGRAKSAPLPMASGVDGSDNTALFGIGCGEKKDGDEDHANDLAVSSADLDHWAEPISGKPGHFAEAPKLTGCGPWEIPLPGNMDLEVHLLPHRKESQDLLGDIRLHLKSQPPTVTIRVSPSQLAHALSDDSGDGFMERHINTIRWRAYRVILSWAYHLKEHARPPSLQPMGIVEFIKAHIVKEGDLTRDSMIQHIKGLNGRPFFAGRDFQLPALPMKRRRSDEDEEQPLPGPETSLPKTAAPPTPHPPHDLEPRQQSRVRSLTFATKEASPFVLPNPKPQPARQAGDAGAGGRSSEKLSETTLETLRRLHAPPSHASSSSTAQASRPKRRRVMQPFESDEESQRGGHQHQRSRQAEITLPKPPTQVPKERLHDDWADDLEDRIKKEELDRELEERMNPWYMEGDME